MKKVLSLALAAAMAFTLSASAFAALHAADTSSAIGEKNISRLYLADNNADFDDVTVEPGDDLDFIYSVAATGKTKLSSYNFEPAVSVKGPADVTSIRIDRNSFVRSDNLGTEDDPIYTVQFDVTFTVTPTNDDATELKDLVLTYGYKLSDASGSGFKADTVKSSENDQYIRAGYEPDPNDDLYDQVVEYYDDMVDYEEDSFEVEMGENPVIPTSVIKFLQKNLANDETVIFVKDGDSVYFDDAATLELTGKQIKTLSASKHINVGVNDEEVAEISDVLDEAGVDYTWFNYVTHQSATGIHSFDSGYTNPYVYLVDAEGALTEVDVIDYDYGDVAFEGPMGQYVVTEGAIPSELFVEEEVPEEPEEPIEDDDVIDEPIEDDDNIDDIIVDEDGNSVEENPGTGSSNMISLAVGMAVVSLAAAGVIASKKADR